MKIDDQQLDTWLRDISVPEKLRKRLMQLPSAASIHDDTATYGKAYVIAAIALAASLAGLALMYWRPRATEHQVGELRRPALLPSDNESNDSEAGNTLATRVLSGELDDIRIRGDFIADAVHYFQADRLRLRLNASGLDETLQTPSIGLDERAALIVSLAGQTALESGATRDWVKREMSMVIERFPATQGATIARQLLADETIQ